MISPEAAVPCKFCGTPTLMLGTKLCDPCWEAERWIERIAKTPGLRALMTKELNTMTPTNIVQKAIDHDVDYFHKCCEQRAATGQGSRFPRLTPDAVEALIRALIWEPYTHSAVEPPAQAYIARGVPGIMGMVHIEDVPEDADLCWSDPKETGYAECVWKAPAGVKGHAVDFVVALVGPEGDLWTFFPGDPVQPSTVERGKGPVSRETAKKVGVTWVKLG